MLLEADLLDGHNLIYKDRIDPCRYPDIDYADLVQQADIVFIVEIHDPSACAEFVATQFYENLNVVFVGPKNFGYNLNVFRLEPELRPHATVRIPDDVVARNERNKGLIVGNRYIDLISLASLDGKSIRVFDDFGMLLSADRVHITKAGAVYFGHAIQKLPAMGFMPK